MRRRALSAFLLWCFASAARAQDPAPPIDEAGLPRARVDVEAIEARFPPSTVPPPVYKSATWKGRHLVMVVQQDGRTLRVHEIVGARAKPGPERMLPITGLSAGDRVWSIAGLGRDRFVVAGTTGEKERMFIGYAGLWSFENERASLRLYGRHDVEGASGRGIIDYLDVFPNLVVYFDYENCTVNYVRTDHGVGTSPKLRQVASPEEYSELRRCKHFFLAPLRREWGEAALGLVLNFKSRAPEVEGTKIPQSWYRVPFAIRLADFDANGMFMRFQATLIREWVAVPFRPVARSNGILGMPS